MPLERDRVGLVLLGASEFPDSTHFTGSEAFLNSKKRIKDFFLNAVQINNEQILDLFDQDLSPNTIDASIESFVTKRKGGMQDLFIFYSGHGGYDSLNGGFLLAIRQSRDANLGVSSVTAKSLGKTLTKSAYDLRLFLILDCCFAAEIYTEFFQSPVNDVIEKQISSSFPEKGLALLCSTSKDDPSLIIKERGITMFSEGLENALRKGTSRIEREYLSLRELGTLTYSYIKDMNKGEGVRPEVHTLIMPKGDIADIPLFTNFAYQQRGTDIAYNIETRKEEIESNMMDNNVMIMRSLFISFVKDFDKEAKYSKEKVKLASRCLALEDLKPTKEDIDRYERYLGDRMKIYEDILTIINEIYPK